MTRFEIFGGLTVWHQGRDRTPSPPKVRQMLALLLVQSNRVVHVDTIIDELWDTEPPASAVTTTQTYVYQLRKLIGGAGLVGSSGELLVTQSPGYLLRVDPDQVDETAFRARVARGRGLLAHGRHEEASALLREALAGWVGSPLSNVTRGRLLSAHVVHLEELRIAALMAWVEAQFALGRHRDLIADLRALVTEHPLNEWFHGRLIEALGRAGRRSEALLAYQTLRTTLADELGLDPSAEIQALQRTVLRSA
ncbi:AfsR/SARP family transcriptional regulator [Pseudofrankia inefficax]|uniref:AfsR/SARP family transcriptional regulator n=1 Tax=Pseudofrankia inefficax (strain DSM 45817 / CECT 9037 / DDB 130130 / EuI1c) TaxID=298654 RepID=UPI00031F053D|nr:AfsR/SARP family transcriptional regulator [Pseudofrankia inefficax]